MDARFRQCALTRRREWSAAFKLSLAILADTRPDGLTPDVSAVTGVRTHNTLNGISASPRSPMLDAAVATLTAGRLPAAMTTLLLFPVRGITVTP